MRCWSSTIFFSAMFNTSEKYISKHLPQGGVGSLVPVFLTPFGKKKKEKFKVVLNPLLQFLKFAKSLVVTFSNTEKSMIILSDDTMIK